MKKIYGLLVCLVQAASLGASGPQNTNNLHAHSTGTAARSSSASATSSSDFRSELIDLAERKLLTTAVNRFTEHQDYANRHPEWLNVQSPIDGNTVSHFAVMQDHPGAFAFFIERNARVDIKNKKGQTARDLVKGKRDFELLIQMHCPIIQQPLAPTESNARDSRIADALQAQFSALASKIQSGVAAGRVAGECEICAEDTDSAFKCECGSIICGDCFDQLCNTNTNTPSNIQCGRCHRLWPLESVEPSKRNVLVANFRKQITNASPDGKFCPTPNCQFHFIDRVAKNHYQIISCTDCRAQYCTHCLINHPQAITCVQALAAQAAASQDKANAEWIRLNTQACPNCKKAIQRNEGCSHMFCNPTAGGCGHNFTYNETPVEQLAAQKRRWEAERANRALQEQMELQLQEQELRQVAEYEARQRTASNTRGTSNNSVTTGESVTHTEIELPEIFEVVLHDKAFVISHKAEARLLQSFYDFMQGTIRREQVASFFAAADLDVALPFNLDGLPYNFDLRKELHEMVLIFLMTTTPQKTARYANLIQCIAENVQTVPREYLMQVRARNAQETAGSANSAPAQARHQDRRQPVNLHANDDDDGDESSSGNNIHSDDESVSIAGQRVTGIFTDTDDELDSVADQPLTRIFADTRLPEVFARALQNRQFSSMHNAEAALLHSFYGFLEGTLTLQGVADAFAIADLEVALPNDGLPLDIALAFAVRDFVDQAPQQTAPYIRHANLLQLIAENVQSVPREHLIQIRARNHQSAAGSANSVPVQGVLQDRRQPENQHLNANEGGETAVRLAEQNRRRDEVRRNLDALRRRVSDIWPNPVAGAPSAQPAVPVRVVVPPIPPVPPVNVIPPQPPVVGGGNPGINNPPGISMPVVNPVTPVNPVLINGFAKKSGPNWTKIVVGCGLVTTALVAGKLYYDYYHNKKKVAAVQ